MLMTEQNFFLYESHPQQPNFTIHIINSLAASNFFHFFFFLAETEPALKKISGGSIDRGTFC